MTEHTVQPVRGTGLRVLVVDDEPSVCRAIEVALTRAGYSVRAVLSGEEAERAVVAERFDALVTDLRMRDIRGDTVFHFAVAHQPHLRDRTVFVTGDITIRGEELIAACGCPMIRKPFELSELFSVMRMLTATEESREAGG